MRDEDEALETDTIELADTRPAMVWLPYLGELPVPGAAIILSGFGFMMAALGSWMWLIPIIPVWWGASRIIALDYHAFTRIQIWLNTSAWSRDAGTEGGASVAPFPLRPDLTARALAAIGLRRLRPRGVA